MLLSFDVVTRLDDGSVRDEGGGIFRAAVHSLDERRRPPNDDGNEDANERVSVEAAAAAAAKNGPRTLLLVGNDGGIGGGFVILVVVVVVCGTSIINDGSCLSHTQMVRKPQRGHGDGNKSLFGETDAPIDGGSGATVAADTRL
jgi:hypothetical protein